MYDNILKTSQIAEWWRLIDLIIVIFYYTIQIQYQIRQALITDYLLN